MASRSFLNQMREIHGEDSPWWRSNILGLFPGQESVRFLPVGLARRLHARRACRATSSGPTIPPGRAFMGVDIGGGVGADRSVIVVRNRKQMLAVFASEWHGVLDDARHRLEPVVVELARKWGVHGRPHRLRQGGHRPLVRLVPGELRPRRRRGLLRRGQGGQALRQPPHRQRVRAQAPARSAPRGPRPVLLRRHPRVAGPAPGAGRAAQPDDGDRGRRRSSRSSKTRRPSPPGCTARPTCSMRS